MDPIADNTSRQLDLRFIRLERVAGQITTAVLSLVGLIIVLAIVGFSSSMLATNSGISFSQGT